MDDPAPYDTALIDAHLRPADPALQVMLYKATAADLQVQLDATRRELDEARVKIRRLEFLLSVLGG